jgi:hypothetical protein
VLDGFQPRGRFGDPVSAVLAEPAGRAAPSPGERETGTAMKTVPVEVLARMMLG